MRDETSNQIDDAAIRWAARMDRSPLEPDEQMRLDVWLATDPRCVGALMRARAALMRFDLLDTLDVAPQSARFGWPITSRRGIALAGTGVLVAGLATVMLLPGSVHYSSAIGEVRMIPLDDGSVVTLNTQSEMQVRYSGDRRMVTLSRGEGYFEVAKNKARPFIVSAGGTQVRAVGTAFTVRVMPNQYIDVRVSEGVVEVDRPPATAAIRLDANMHALVPPDRLLAIRSDRLSNEEIARDLLWREGRLSFERSTLGSAVAEFNRYNSVKIVFDDPAIGARRVTGLFSANDPHGFAQAIALTMGLALKEEAGNILLVNSDGAGMSETGASS